MKHISIWLSVGAFCCGALLLGMTSIPAAAQEEAGDALPQATSTTTLYTASETDEAPTGWQQDDNGIWYYYDTEGVAVTGEVAIDGQAYLFGADGALGTGWQTVSGVRQYFNPFTGRVQTGWITYQQAYYYADPETGKLDGVQYGLTALDGTSTTASDRFVFDSYGALQLGHFMGDDGGFYYADPNTGIIATGDVQIDEMWYRFDTDGKQQTGWVTIQSKRYYFDPDTGKSLQGLVQIEGDTYYITSAGMQTGQQKIAGMTYYFQTNGKLLKNSTVDLDGVTYQANDAGILTHATIEEAPVEAISPIGQTSIMGRSAATAAQMTAYIRSVNPDVAQSVIDMIPYYLSEGEKEGVRGDIAFAQSCLETGNFGFVGSAVTLDQNNFCGMGVTSNGMKGNSFDTPQLGIRAQIQHLKAYASTEDLVQACIDPRFQYVRRECAPYVEWLGIQENPQGYGWAAGAGYGAAILRILAAILRM